MNVESPQTLLIENRVSEMARVERWLGEVSAAGRYPSARLLPWIW
jgi:hypothetical protein